MENRKDVRLSASQKEIVDRVRLRVAQREAAKDKGRPLLVVVLALTAVGLFAYTAGALYRTGLMHSVSDAPCEQRPQCMLDRYAVAVEQACFSQVLARAAYDARRVATPAEIAKLVVYDIQSERLTLRTDLIELQLGLGAWARHRLTCWVHVPTDTLMVSELERGRLI